MDTVEQIIPVAFLGGCEEEALSSVVAMLQSASIP